MELLATWRTMAGMEAQEQMSEVADLFMRCTPPYCGSDNPVLIAFDSIAIIELNNPFQASVTTKNGKLFKCWDGSEIERVCELFELPSMRPRRIA